VPRDDSRQKEEYRDEQAKANIEIPEYSVKSLHIEMACAQTSQHGINLPFRICPPEPERVAKGKQEDEDA